MSDDVMKVTDAELQQETLEIMPLVDILDGSDGVTMWFEVPGANSKSVNIEVKEGVMTMTAASSLRRDGKNWCSNACSSSPTASMSRRSPPRPRTAF